MEEAVAHVVAPPISSLLNISRTMSSSSSSLLCATEAPTIIRKRPSSSSTNHHSNTHSTSDWNPLSWDWDCSRFVATSHQSTPVHHIHHDDALALNLGTSAATTSAATPIRLNTTTSNSCSSGGAVEEPPVVTTRPPKKVRSGSPGSTSYPVCQVDNCKEDLSTAKDYHRRHKVCEAHSKATKALVSNHMQRFCQQCSRFHLLSEFDEGKRSCRRRLAGHNRRRRKTTLPEDVTSRVALPANEDATTPGNFDIVNLLTALARSRGVSEAKSIDTPPLPERDQIIQILSRINSLPLPMDIAGKLSNIASLNGKYLQQHLSEKEKTVQQLLAILSATPVSPAPEALAFLSLRSSQSNESEKSKVTCSDQWTDPITHNKLPSEIPSSAAKKRSSCSYPYPTEHSDSQMQETCPSLPFQLFSSSLDNDSPPKLSSSRKYFSSDSSNPIEERSPSSSPPVVQKLFPLQSREETVTSAKMFSNTQVNSTVEGGRTLDLFGGSTKGARHLSYASPRNQVGYTSSSSSDHSPSSQDFDIQDRTGRILFKLFDKDPSHFPGTLRTQIYRWLSNSPAEMESYIRPGCIVLSVYLSMSSSAWDHLERNLHQLVNSLVQDSDSTLWQSGRFILYAGRQLASHMDGKIHISKSWKSWSSPELISVSPLAIDCGQETSLRLRGRNLTNPGTKIHCTYMGGYTSKEVTGLTYQWNGFDEVKLDSFKVSSASTSAFGRCFIEVENGFKGNSLPIIIADATICKELRLLESEFEEDAEACDIVEEEQAHDQGGPRSREEVLDFLNEVGWLFQRKGMSPLLEVSDFSLGRFKFLLIFSVERDYCSLIKTILDMLVERNLDSGRLSKESSDMLSDVQLLNRAVKRRCRKMVDLLIHYSISCSDSFSKSYIFQPNLVGPGDITPLHLAASTSDSYDLVDALTNDPQQIGLLCWSSLLDANGCSPYSYAVMTSNHSYNILVASKISDKRNGQVSLTIGNERDQNRLAVKQRRTSCERCAIVAAKYDRKVLGSQGLLQRPFVHSMLAIAAVCVCVCLFLRGGPYTGTDINFTWEKLEFGTS